MDQQKTILHLLDNLEIEGIRKIKKTLIYKHFQLLDSRSPDCSPHFNVESEAVDLYIGSDGTINAKSFKMYNFLKFSQSYFRLSILNLIGSVGALISGELIITMLGVLGILGAFLGNSKKEYNELDAKVLLTIYRLGKICHIKSIPQEFKILFGEEISEAKLDDSLIVLSKFRTIDVRGEEVLIVETISISKQ